MKYIVLLFSFYFVSLAVLPCQDRDEINGDEIHATFQKGHAQSGERGLEVCSPLCNCACCSSVRYLTPTYYSTVFTKPVIREYPDLNIPSIQDQPINIWQPPQIG